MNRKVKIIIFVFILFFGLFLINSINKEITLTIIESDGEKGFAIYTEDGDILFADDIEISKSMTNKGVVKASGYKIYNPIGIVKNPPREMITDIKGKVLEFLSIDERVLLIYIDGLGYEAYEKAMESGYLSHISTLEKGVKALTVYPPITDVTFASMVTGVTPKFTGIHSREKKLLTVDTVFDEAGRMGKTSKVIEGNIRIINDEVETILNIDENKNGTIDDEIYGAALKEIERHPDFLLVHFHSYDDFAHEYGPFSKEAFNQLKVLDTYVQDLMGRFSGKVIITSDHGMHDEDEGGNHGEFTTLDIFIPIIIH